MRGKEICEKVPVAATYHVTDGSAVKVDGEYANIPADAMADFLIEKFGHDAIFKSEGGAP